MIEKQFIKTIEVELADICNLSCPLCPRKLEAFSVMIGNKPTFRPVSDLMEQLAQFPCLEEVHLIGQMSEPTLHPDFLEIVERCKNAGYRVVVYTNGSGKRGVPDFWNRLNDILDENDDVTFTVCGMDQEHHERYRVGSKLDDILAASSVLMGKGISTGVCIRFVYNDIHTRSPEFEEFMKTHFSRYRIICSDQIEGQPEPDFLPPVDSIKGFRLLKLEMERAESGCGLMCEHLDGNGLFIDIRGNIWPCPAFFQEAVERNVPEMTWNRCTICGLDFRCCRKCTIPATKIRDYYDLDG